MKTREEVEDLKVQWLRDPIWDIENTEGFEDFKDELFEFQKAKSDEWAERAAKKRKRQFLNDSAFSYQPIYDDGMIAIEGEQGLSRREYFTAAVLTGLCSQDGYTDYEKDQLAEMAVNIADATLAHLYNTQQ